MAHFETPSRCRRPLRNNRRGAAHRFLLWAFAALLPLTSVWAATQYLYDDLGRLVLVAATDGSATVYEHDANGNIVEITQWGASGPVIGTFTPAYGHVGTTVTILGTGFSAMPSQNTVTVGGAAAIVSGSTTTSITTAIPNTAVTGPITVTVGGVTATSAHDIIVLRPTITSFSPATVAPGGSVTVNGANFNLVPGGTTLKVGNTSVTVTSLSNTQAVFTAPSGGVGHVIVNTSYGEATSSTNLTVIPTAIGLANVVSNSAISAGGAGVGVSIGAQNKYATLNFDAIAGQYFSIQVSSLTTTPANGYVNYTLYSSTGASLATGYVVSTTTLSVHLPKIPTTGAYFVAFASASNSSVSLTANLELNQALSKTGASTSASTTTARQSKRFTFDATAGDDIGLAISSLTITPNSPNYVRVWLYRPDGLYVNSFWGYSAGNPGSGENFMNVPQTGTYTVLVEPQGASTMSFNLTVSDDVAGSLMAGTPMTLNLARVGQLGLLTFTASAGQTVALHVGSISTTPSGKNVSMTVYNPSGSAVASGSNASQTTHNLTNLSAGTYSVLLQPADAATGSMQLTLANGVTGTLPSNGTSQSFSTTVPRQNGYATFSATAGDDVGVALTGLSLSPSSPNYVRFWVFRPDGYSITGNYCSVTTSPGCGESLMNLPLTGTYTVMIEPQGASTMSYTLTLSNDVTGTLSAGTPMAVNLNSPGRVGLPTFSRTAGQTVALHLGSISTTPSGKNVTMTVYNPSGSPVQSVSGSSQAIVNIASLPATGTYSVHLQAQDAATASMQLTLASGLNGTLTANGTGQSFSSTVPRQNGYFTFSATAGDDLALALTGLSLSPSSPNYVRVYVNRPEGYSLTSFYCYTTGNPGCSEAMMNLPSTGTYTVIVEPQGYSTMSFALTLSQAVTASLTAGTPSVLSLTAPGQMGLPTFTATAGQTYALRMDSISTTPSGKSLTMTVYGPTGTWIGSATNASGATLNLTSLPSTGTYSVLLVPPEASTASVTMTLANGAAASLPSDGSSQSFNTTVASQNGYFTFSATAGADFSLAITGVSLNPSTTNYLQVRVDQVGGGNLANFNCAITVSPGCRTNLMNLPATGTYSVQVLAQAAYTMGFTLTLSQDSTGTLTTGTPLSVNLAVPGKLALPTFTATAGQSLSVTLSSISTTPTGKSVTLSVFNPSGGQIASTSNTTQATLNLSSLAAGTYSVLVMPADAATATGQLQIQ